MGIFLLLFKSLRLNNRLISVQILNASRLTFDPLSNLKKIKTLKFLRHEPILVLSRRIEEDIQVTQNM
jgi:hypothetical protein